MNIIKLFLLFSLMLWAEFKLDIPQNIDVIQLENIVKNGWNESNVTLNHFIVSHVERVMPEVLEKIKNPVIKVSSSKKEPFPIPNLLMNKYDYWLIVSYCEYLEYNGERDKALGIYVKILDGLNHIDDKSMLSVIFRMVVESMVVERMAHGIKHNYYTEFTKIDLKKGIEKKILVDYDKYFIAIENEKRFVLDASRLSFFKEPIDEDIGYYNFMNAVYKSLESHVNHYFLKMTNALKISMKNNNTKAVDNFLEYMKNEKEEHLKSMNVIHAALSAVIVKIKSLFGLGGQGNSYMALYVGRTTALVAVPLIKSTYLDYVNFIEKNKNLLKELESVNKAI